MKRTIWLISFLSLFLFFSCKKEKNNNTAENIKDSILVNNLPNVIKVKDKLFSVPSPINLSNFVKQQNVPFEQSLLNSPQNYTKYLTTFKKSLNVGVYGADLAELYVYDQLSESGQYFSIIKKLSEEIGVLNNINQKLFTRIQNNSENKDSLIYIMTTIYRNIDNYLLENQQQDVGILILAGGWVESVYYLTQILKTDKNPELISRLAEQKSPLNNIIKLLNPYYNLKSDEIDKLIEELVNLSIIYDEIKETYSYAPPETDPQRKITYIHSKTTYNITEEQINEIIKKVEALRNWIIK